MKKWPYKTGAQFSDVLLSEIWLDKRGGLLYWEVVACSVDNELNYSYRLSLLKNVFFHIASLKFPINQNIAMELVFDHQNAPSW